MTRRVPMVALALLALTGCQSGPGPMDRLTGAPPDALQARVLRRLQLASAYYEQNQDAVAQQEIRAALQIDPANAEAYNLLGLDRKSTRLNSSH